MGRKLGGSGQERLEKGADLGEALFFDHGLPFLSMEFPEYVDNLAAGVLWEGSEAMGLDDEISRDHHWEPRFNVILTNDDFAKVGEEMERSVRDHLPSSFRGFRRYLPKGYPGTMRVHIIDGFFMAHTKNEAMLGAQLEIEMEGRGVSIRRTDAMIAAATMNRNASLYTFDTNHFGPLEVQGLKLVK